jgi:hypothetical protein
MSDGGEVMASRHLVGPPLHVRLLDLDRQSTSAAHQMMVMGLRAPAVRRLTVGGAQDVDGSLLGKCLQGPVHGRQANGFTPRAQLLVELLGASELGLVG